MLAFDRKHQSFKSTDRRLRAMCHVASHLVKSEVTLHKSIRGVTGRCDHEAATRVGIFEWLAR